MPWYLWSLVANLAVIAIEHANRGAPPGGTWLDVLPRTLPMIALAQLGIYYAFRDAPTWFAAWVAFAIGSQVCRVAAVAATAPGEVTSWPLVAAGIAVVLGGGYVIRHGLAG